jgi:hypothetical protein
VTGHESRAQGGKAGRVTRQNLPSARVQAADASIQPIEFHGLSSFEVRAWTS